MTGEQALEVVRSMREVASIQLAKLEPNDVIVLEYPGCLSRHAADNLARHVALVFGDRRVVVLDQGMTLKVARA